MKLDYGYADTDRMNVTVTRLDSAKVKIVYDMAANNPLLPSPDIDYDLELIIDFSDPGNPTWQLTGSHDGFPCYEVYLGESRLHHYDSGSETPTALGGAQEKSVNQSGPVILEEE